MRADVLNAGWAAPDLFPSVTTVGEAKDRPTHTVRIRGGDSVTEIRLEEDGCERGLDGNEGVSLLETTNHVQEQTEEQALRPVFTARV